MKPFPPGLDPVTAGRFGLWLLGKRSHQRSLKRTLSASRVCGSGYASRFVYLIVPWRIEEYPGAIQALAETLGVKRSTARDYLERRLPKKHYPTLEWILRAKAAQMIALADELAGKKDQGF